MHENTIILKKAPPRTVTQEVPFCILIKKDFRNSVQKYNA